MTRFLTAVAVLLLVLVTACGGVENEPNLVKAVERTEATGSSRFELEAPLVEDGRTLDYSCEGAADYARNRLRLACNYGLSMIEIGDTQYLTSESFGVRGDTRWVKVPVEESDSVSNYFSPEWLLGMLRDASLATGRIGEESVRQVPTVRYRLTVNCDEVQINCPGSTAPVDVWIDDGGLVRRIELEVDGGRGTIEFFDFGVEAIIEPPPTEEIAGLGDIGAGPGPPCTADDATPISEGRALDALRRHGFTVDRDDSRPCPANVAAVLENAPKQFDREGYVSCFLYTKPPNGAPKTVVRRGVDGGDAELLLANLTCMILADSPNAEEKIRPLEQAFEELERAIRP